MFVVKGTIKQMTNQEKFNENRRNKHFMSLLYNKFFMSSPFHYKILLFSCLFVSFSLQYIKNQGNSR